MPAPWTAHAIARIKGEIHGQQTVNVLHFATNSAVNGGADIALLTELIVALMQCVETVLLPAVSSDWNVGSVEAQYIGTVLPTTTTDTIATGPTGAGVGQLSPTSVSFAASLMQLRTGVKGKSGRGHIFLPPPGETEILASTIDDPTLVKLVAFANCVIGKFVGVGATTSWRLGVFSKKLGGNNFANFDNSFSEVRNLAFANKLAAITRRRVGHGN